MPHKVESAARPENWAAAAVPRSDPDHALCLRSAPDEPHRPPRRSSTNPEGSPGVERRIALTSAIAEQRLDAQDVWPPGGRGDTLGERNQSVSDISDACPAKASARWLDEETICRHREIAAAVVRSEQLDPRATIGSYSRLSSPARRQ
jgi:hypothetical protein